MVEPVAPQEFSVKDLDTGKCFRVEEIDQYYSHLSLDAVVKMKNLESKEAYEKLLYYYTSDESGDVEIEFIPSPHELSDSKPVALSTCEEEMQCEFDKSCQNVHCNGSGFCDEHEIKAREDEDARAQALFFIPKNGRAEFDRISGYGYARDAMNRFYTVYTLEMYCKASDKTWKVYRRYQEFKLLNERLRLIGFRMPIFPPKKLIGSFDPDFVSRRQSDLTIWLHKVLLDNSSSNPNGKLMHEDDEMRRFFTWKADQPPFPMSMEAPSSGLPPLAPDVDNPDKRMCEEEDWGPSKNASYDNRVRLSDFEMIQSIGKGSFGRVVLVGHKKTKKKYAMKILTKSNIIRRRQVEHTRTERRVLGYTKHPFIVGLHYAFQTPKRLFFILDFCPGGELFYHLTRLRKLPEDMARFYVAEIVLALEHLHKLGVIYRDLKPENILLDKHGHVKLADFGLAKEGITESACGTHSLCGTPEYLPPEILDRAGHGNAVDWWNLGMVMFEMLTGLPPWYTNDRQKLFERIRSARLNFPPYISLLAENFIRLLLRRNPEDRLGYHGAAEVKAHPFFDGINWQELYNRKVKPPLNPCSKEKAFNFEREFTRQPFPSVELYDKHKKNPVEIDTFAEFAYENPTAFQRATKGAYTATS